MNADTRSEANVLQRKLTVLASFVGNLSEGRGLLLQLKSAIRSEMMGNCEAIAENRSPLIICPRGMETLARMQNLRLFDTRMYGLVLDDFFRLYWEFVVPEEGYSSIRACAHFDLTLTKRIIEVGRSVYDAVLNVKEDAIKAVLDEVRELVAKERQKCDEYFAALEHVAEASRRRLAGEGEIPKAESGDVTFPIPSLDLSNQHRSVCDLIHKIKQNARTLCSQRVALIDDGIDKLIGLFDVWLAVGKTLNARLEESLPQSDGTTRKAKRKPGAKPKKARNEAILREWKKNPNVPHREICAALAHRFADLTEDAVGSVIRRHKQQRKDSTEQEPANHC